MRSSYVLREGRFTPAQRRACAEGWPKFGIKADGAIDPATAFGRAAPLVLEIGFGNGDVLAEMAGCEPGVNFLGIEVYRPGIGSLLRKIDAQELSNIRIVRGDAAVVIHQLPNACLDRVLILFPDPWPKTKHHKRRLVKPDFAAALADRMRPGGLLHLATDWAHYAQAMCDAIENSGRFNILDGGNRVSTAPGWRPLTRYEERGRAGGRKIFQLDCKAIGP